jgi:hypothetical protein
LQDRNTTKQLITAVSASKLNPNYIIFRDTAKDLDPSHSRNIKFIRNLGKNNSYRYPFKIHPVNIPVLLPVNPKQEAMISYWRTGNPLQNGTIILVFSIFFSQQG